MRKLIWIFAIIVIGSLPASAALSVANKANSNGTSCPASTTACATSAGISTTTGNLLVAVFHSAIGGDVLTSITDTAMNSFVTSGCKVTGSNSQVSYLYYAKNITGNASDVVTANTSGGVTDSYVYVWEISGADISAPFDVCKTGTQAAGTATVTSASFSTAIANEIVVASAADFGVSSSYTAQASYTLDLGAIPVSGGTGLGGAEHQIFSSIQTTITTAMTCSTSANGQVIIVGAFKQASAVTLKAPPMIG